MKKINLVLIAMLVVTTFSQSVNVWAEETITIETPTEILYVNNESGSISTNSITNDSSPTFTGITLPNTDIQLEITNCLNIGCPWLVAGTTTSNEKGKWSFTIFSQNNGNWKARAIALTNTGNIQSSEFNFTIDAIVLVPPVVTSPASGSYEKISPLVITGTCDYHIDINDLIIGFSNFGDIMAVGTECLPDGTFTSSTPYSQTVNQITYPISFSVYYKDFIQSASEQVLLTDPCSASSTCLRINSMSEDTGVSDTDFITKDNTPNFSGTANPNTEVRVLATPMIPCVTPTPELPCAISSVLIGVTTSDEFGNWTVLNTAAPLSDAMYRAYAQADIHGSYFSSDDITFTIDTQAPRIDHFDFYHGATGTVNFDNTNCLGCANAFYVNTSNIVIVGEILEGLSLLETEILFWDMNEATVSELSGEANMRSIGHSKTFTIYDHIHFDLSELNLPEGDYRAVVMSKDIAGNEISFGEKTFTFTIDSTGPVAPVITSPVEIKYSTDNTFSISGTCDANERLIDLTYEALDGTILAGKGDPEYPGDSGKIGELFYFMTGSSGEGIECGPEGTFQITMSMPDNVTKNLTPHIKLGVVQYNKAGNMSKVSNIITISKQESSGGGGGGGGGGGNPPPEKCTILGDINCDGRVNKYDFALMMVPWGLKVTNEKADLSVDGLVNKYDFALLMSNWGYGEVKR